MPCALDRPEKPVVVERRRGPRPRTYERPEDESRHMTTPSLARGALVEDDEDGSLSERGAPEKRSQERAQPRVSGRDRAVVHVVAEVGHDETEVRERARCQIPAKGVERNDPA